MSNQVTVLLSLIAGACLSLPVWGSDFDTSARFTTPPAYVLPAPGPGHRYGGYHQGYRQGYRDGYTDGGGHQGYISPYRPLLPPPQTRRHSSCCGTPRR